MTREAYILHPAQVVPGVEQQLGAVGDDAGPLGDGAVAVRLRDVKGAGQLLPPLPPLAGRVARQEPWVGALWNDRVVAAAAARTPPGHGHQPWQSAAQDTQVMAASTPSSPDLSCHLLDVDMAARCPCNLGRLLMNKKHSK